MVPAEADAMMAVFEAYVPLCTPEAREKVLKGNYERLFNEARRKVRRWEWAELNSIDKS